MEGRAPASPGPTGGVRAVVDSPPKFAVAARDRGLLFALMELFP